MPYRNDHGLIAPEVVIGIYTEIGNGRRGGDVSNEPRCSCCSGARRLGLSYAESSNGLIGTDVTALTGRTVRVGFDFKVAAELLPSAETAWYHRHFPHGNR